MSSKITLISQHYPNYQSLADITWKNKQEYAAKYDYRAILPDQKMEESFTPLGIAAVGYTKIEFIKNLLESEKNYKDFMLRKSDFSPETRWFWWTGTDTLITNFNKNIADVIDDKYHFVISTDCNGINADSFLVRNSPEAKFYIDYIWSIREKYLNHPSGWYEQQAIIETYNQFKSIIKIVPQRHMNSYDYIGLYPWCKPYDLLGVYGQWQHGDLLIHWPGTSLNKRIELAKRYEDYIIR